MEVIAHIYTDFPEKFGIPRQSGLVEELKGRIEFEKKYASFDGVKGLEQFDYIWLLWEFDVPESKNFQATVKPPRLGGNTPMGVFATRSPFRPNRIGLSSVKLDSIETTSKGPVLHVSGIDIKDGTKIYDIKPYLPHVDSHPEARGGFALDAVEHVLKVSFPEQYLGLFPEDKKSAVIALLRQDPRPSYHEDATRKYGVTFAGLDIHFTVDGDVLTVYEVVEATEDNKVKK